MALSSQPAMPVSAIDNPLRRARAWADRARFMSLADIGLFLHSARTDATLARLRPELGGRAAFEAIYTDQSDPWGSADRGYRYQRLKYEQLVAMLPPGRRFSRALDLGCGLGLMSRLLARRSDDVLGLDVAQAAVDRARTAHADIAHLRFDQGDALNLPRSMDGQFDLLALADILYYLSPLDDAVLKAVAMRLADLLAPGGVCLLANHFFFAADPESRMSRRIHRAFAWSPRFKVISEHRRAFYLATVLTEVPCSVPSPA